MGKDDNEGIYLFLTGAEARRSNLPFLLDTKMRPITAANAWLRKVAQDGSTSSPHTHRTYAYALFDFFSYLVKRRVDWRKITNDIFIQYRDVQDENSSPHTKRPLNRRTINARLLVVERFFTFASENNFIEKNPITYKKIKSRRPPDTAMLAHLRSEQEVKVPLAKYERLPISKVKWLHDDKVTEWVNSIQVWRDKLLSRILYHTGMRRQEIVSLKVKDLPQRDSVNTAIPGFSLEIVGKGRRRRSIYIAIRDLLDLYDYIKLVRSPLVRMTQEKHDFIFVNRKGLPLRPNYVNQIFKRVSEKCGINITPHMLRHSFAVYSLKKWNKHKISQPEILLQARLGHANVTTTQIYMHMTDEMMANEARANASLIDQLLRGECDETQ